MNRLSTEKLIDRLYDAAIDSDCWQDTLTSLAGSLGAECLVFGYGRPGAAEKPNIFTCGWDHSYLKAGGFIEEDIWDPSVNPGVAAGCYMPIAKSFDRRELIPDNVFATSEFIHCTVVMNDCLNHRLMAPYRSQDVLSGGFFAKKGGRDFIDSEVRAIDAMLPHLGRAMRLRTELDRQRVVSHGLGQVLERLGKAVFVLDADAALLFANKFAEQILATENGFRLQFGRIKFPKRLEQAIKIQVNGSKENACPCDVSIGAKAQGRQWRARVYPATGFADLPGTATAAVVVVIEEQQPPPMLPDAEALCDLFGLTKAEAAIARLVPTGGTKRQIAEALFLSENTVKSHLMSIRSKVGARSVVELTHILARL
ncbi:helix-turn-helix transcriptional regulator [Roseibium sp. HPY-6]|uniref:helix-turn-helix transcriptional regulator n=1 Tax=Roseibium sp. HPY-6 TaxID=3229852 RepID=UPI00338D6C5F